MNKDGALFFQYVFLILGILAGFFLNDLIFGIIFMALSLLFGFWAYFIPRTNKKGPGLREQYNKWYHGSSLEKYQKATAYGKGDYAGYWYMGFVAFCFFVVVTVFPITAFWFLLSYFNIIIAMNVNTIIYGSCLMAVPQFFYLWGLAYDDYHKRTGKLKSK